jgi:glycosyltransferase involved in cell wall biosynthesis
LALVEATARLVRRLPAIRVLLVGEFSDDAYRREVLGRAESLGVLGNVIVTGFQANPFPLATRCDVIVLPTQRDPFPIALLEAMALAKPVVATAVGGIPEMIRDGESGVVVPPNDIDALASAIAGVIEDPTRGRRLGEAARERLLARFSQEGFFGKMFDALNRAARRR